MAFRFYTTYYRDNRDGRQAELDLCLQLNASAFPYMRIRADSGGEFSERPLWKPEFLSEMTSWLCMGRCTFSNMLAEAEVLCEEDDISVIANTDIVIPQSELAKIVASLQPNQVYCLTRWEVSSNQGVHLWDVEYSQDSWVFRGPPKPNIGGDYWFGVPGCDNRLAHELEAAGYEVLNPSKDIRTYHIHASNERTATNSEAHRVPPPYLYIAPHHLGEQPTINRAATYEQRKQVIARRKLKAR